ncbi:unnamed protein product [Periconia digitata]|uniref:RING-type domain-containing protein n=1 Tax=Periconia digitata TaxID=1303443 RepID=A0A9W4XJZ0_9PLEO|nr:unnamed protein product [Periconia digitata]
MSDNGYNPHSPVSDNDDNPDSPTNGRRPLPSWAIEGRTQYYPYTDVPFRYNLRRAKFRANEFLETAPKATAEQKGRDDCFCGEAYDLANHVAIVLPCNHVFGRDCIREWLATNHASCPMCRAELYEDLKLLTDSDESILEDEEGAPPDCVRFGNFYNSEAGEQISNEYSDRVYLMDILYGRTKWDKDLLDEEEAIALTRTRKNCEDECTIVCTTDYLRCYNRESDMEFSFMLRLRWNESEHAAREARMAEFPSWQIREAKNSRTHIKFLLQRISTIEYREDTRYPIETLEKSLQKHEALLRERGEELD